MVLQPLQLRLRVNHSVRITCIMTRVQSQEFINKLSGEQSLHTSNAFALQLFSQD